MKNDERGAVLIVVVLMAVALYAMAHGLLLSARHALGTASIGASLLEVRVAVDAALEEARLDGVGRWADSVGVGRRRVVSDTLPRGDPTRTTWRRLGREAWLLGSTVERTRFTGVASERLVWVYDVLERILEMSYALAIGPSATASLAGTLRASTPSEEREVADATLRVVCDRWWSAWEAASVEAPVVLATVEAPALGLLDLGQLVARAPRLPGATGTPGPREVAGSCDPTDPWNWGDPDRPWRPCGGHFVLRSGVGATTVAGGVGQGVLVVDGDLDLTASARHYGVVVVSGRLRVAEGARLEGLALAFGGADVAAGASIVRSACRAALALDGLRDELGVAIPLHSAVRFGPRGIVP
jgi:hypothetical protein